MSESRPLLVVTPTLGRSPWLDRTVALVANHAGAFAAHVLVAPLAIHDNLRQRFPHCTLVADTGAKGVYPAINLGLAHAPDANWRWFTWINDDDEFTPGFARHLARALEHDGLNPNSPWCYGQVQLLNGSGGYLGRLPVSRYPSDLLTLAQSGINPLNQQGLLVPRTWVDRFGPLREDLRICADVHFWLRAVVAGANFSCSPEVVAIFRLRAGQISGDVELHRAEFREVVQGLAPGTPALFSKLAARARFRLANASVYIGRIRRCGWKGGYDLLRQPVRKAT